MSDQEFKYDVFLSHASEDTEWSLRLAKRLDQEGVRVWFDKWELQPGSHLEAKINDGLEHSRKLVAVWTKSYFADHKAWTLAESYARQHTDILARDRLLIPVLREDCTPKPLQAPLIPVDFRNDADFDIHIRTLIQSLDLPRRDFVDADQADADFALREHDLRKWGRERPRGKIFEDEIARLYRLLSYEVEAVEISGVRIGLQVQKRQGGRMLRDIVACVHPFVTEKEREQILHHQFLAQKQFSNHNLIAVAQSFDARVRADLAEAGFDCATHAELLSELLPLHDYVNGLIAEYEREVDQQWQGEDWFIRPNIETDAEQQTLPALKFFGKWLGDRNRNLMVLLGDLGTGKSTLSKFLAYHLARSYRDDPIRHPAPVLIALTRLYKEASLNSIVTGHFSERGLNNINFNSFQHLAREGRLVIFFDAFDEMADRMIWRETLGNFLALVRAAEGEGKALITCRTHYFKDRDDQAEVIEEAARTLQDITRKFRTEKPLFKTAREYKAEVVYLKEFNDEQIRAYLGKARPATATEDWRKIEETYHLENLAQRPLLLNMIVESLDRFDEGEEIDAAKLYDRYTGEWISREFSKGRLRLNRKQKLAMMMELARLMWDGDKKSVRYRDLLPFVEKLVGAGKIELKDQEIADIAGEIHSASFLKRDESGEFSFMHRSFMEFFLARQLHESLASDEALRAALAARRFDQKVIYFFEKLDRADAARAPLQRLLTGAYQANVSENALQLLYWTARHRVGMEKEVTDVAKLRHALAERIPARAVLTGANLQEITLECVDLAEADLSAADLTKAKLNHAWLSQVNLSGAKLVEMTARGAVLSEVDMRDADLAGSSFNDSRWVGGNLTNAKMENLSLHGAHWYKVIGFVEALTMRRNLIPSVQRGHCWQVLAVAYSPDNQLLATGGGDGLVLIWRASDGALLRALEGHTNWVNAVQFSPDGELLASGSEDNTVRLWQSADGTLLRTLEGHTASVNAVQFSPDGKLLASGSGDNTVRLWQSADGTLLRTLEGHIAFVNAVQFSADGKLLASGSDDNTVRLWQSADGTLLRTLEGHISFVNAVQFSADGKLLASGSEDNTVRLWQSADGTLLRTLEGHTRSVNAVQFSPDGELLVSGSRDKTVRLWQSADGTLLRTLEGHTASVNAVQFSPDGKLLASGSGDNTVRFWQSADGTLLRTLEGHAASINIVNVSVDGKLLASGSVDKTVRLWQSADGTLLRTLEGHTRSVNAVQFSPDGKLLASGSGDKTARLWQSADGTLLRTLEGHTASVIAIQFSADGKLLASGSEDNTVRLWQSADGTLLRTLEGHTSFVNAVQFSPDGRLLASGSGDNTVRLWQSADGTLLRTLEGHTAFVNAVQFSPDGELLASGSGDNTVRFWQSADGTLLRTLEGHTSFVNAVQFSPDGELLASGSEDNTVRLWHSADGKPLHVIEGDLGGIQTVAFAPNGQYLIAAGVKGRLQYIAVATGQTFLYRYDFGAGAWLDLLPDGRFNASPEGFRYLSYTELDAAGGLTLKAYPAEELAQEFYRPAEVRAVLAQYV